MLNKIMAHITQPFKTFRAEEPSHQMLQVHQVQGTSGTKYNRYLVDLKTGTPKAVHRFQVFVFEDRSYCSILNLKKLS